MKKMFLIVLLISIETLQAQQIYCDYNSLMQDGRKYLKQKSYKKALNKFNAAKACDFSHATDVDNELLKVFGAIEKEKEEAITNKSKAELARLEAEAATEQAIQREKEAIAGSLASKSREVFFKDKDYPVSLRLAEAAFNSTCIPTQEARTTLLDILNEIGTTPKDQVILYSERNTFKANGDIDYYVSPNGKYLVVVKGGGGRQLEVWRLDTFKLIRADFTSFFLHSVEKVRFSPNSEYYCVLTRAKAVVQEALTGKTIMERKARSEEEVVYEGIFLDSIKELFLHQRNEDVIRCDSSNNEALILHSKIYLGMEKAFAPNGSFLVALSNNDNVYLFDFIKKDTLQLKAPDFGCRKLCVSNNSKLVAGGCGGKIVVWDAATGKTLMELPGHTSYITDIKFSFDDKFLISGGSDRTVRVWELATQKQTYIIKDLADDPKNVSLSLLNDRITTITDKNELKIWIIQKEDLTSSYNMWGIPYCIKISPDDRMRLTSLSALVSDKATSIYCFKTGKTTYVPSKDINGVYSADFSRDNRYIVMSPHMNNNVIVWDVDSEKTVAKRIPGGSLMCRDVAFSPDGQFVVAACDRDGIVFWDWRNNRVDTIIKGKSWEGFSCVAITRDGKYLLGGEDDVWVWEMASKKLVTKLKDDGTQIFDIDISKDGKKLAVGSAGGHVTIWDLATLTKIKSIPAHSNYIYTVTFSLNDKMICSAGKDRIIKVWDSNTGELIRSLQGHTDNVYMASFAYNDRLIISGSSDLSVRFWRIDLFSLLSGVFKLDEKMKQRYGIPAALYNNLDAIYR